MWLIYFFVLMLQPAPGLDFDAFKATVQPLLTEKRPGHARCITCHSTGTAFRLVRLPQGRTAYTEEESRKNFDIMRRVAQPGNVKSKLLLHPLDEKAGGDFYHNGGKHWTSQNDPEWQILKTWVLGPTSK